MRLKTCSFIALEIGTEADIMRLEKGHIIEDTTIFKAMRLATDNASRCCCNVRLAIDLMNTSTINVIELTIEVVVGKCNGVQRDVIGIIGESRICRSIIRSVAKSLERANRSGARSDSTVWIAGEGAIVSWPSNRLKSVVSSSWGRRRRSNKSRTVRRL